MKTIKDIQYFEGVKVLMHPDLNVPIENGIVTNDYRIRMALPTIDFLCKRGAKVILIGHSESSDGSNGTLLPVSNEYSKLGIANIFIENIRNANSVIENDLKNGGVAMLENLRIVSEGEKKNDPKFAKELASLADIYVNDAFSVCHRKHASTVGVPKFLPSYAGFQLEREILNLSKAFNAPHPFIFILGGAKFNTKLPLLQKFMDKTDSIFVGGALAHDLFKFKGYEVGTSLVSDVPVDLGAIAVSPKLILPIDVMTKDHRVKKSDALLSTDCAYDAGPKTIEALKGKIASAKFILWNGPVGMYEHGFTEGTEGIARMIADQTSKGAETIVGGGDTLAAIAKLGIEDKYSFVSTGGGAMLDYLAQGTLPGIDALESSKE
ncbi:MAG: phosphoglycerate kinase [Candidatus Taylorbacteria bacterium]|nr:phosphoglycerate kinase [Candidatus Taylorbacteria bacterium]